MQNNKNRPTLPNGKTRGGFSAEKQALFLVSQLFAVDLVADALDRFNALARAAQLLTQVADVYVDGTALAVKGIAPNGREDLVARGDGASLFEKQTEKLKFL